MLPAGGASAPVEAVSVRFLKSALHIVYSSYCPFCGRLGEPVCTGCLAGLMSTLPMFCLMCGEALPCARHGNAPPCRAASIYEGGNRDAIRIMKYENGRSIATAMGYLLAGRFARPEADCLVPVPLHKGSERDYNQAKLIAVSAGKTWQIPVRDLLRWNLDVPRQVKTKGTRKRTLPPGAISTDGRIPAGLSAFLIDDVFTTGNTLRAARDALVESGASVCGAAVWSRSRVSSTGLGG